MLALSRAQLLSRKEDLYAAIRQLEQDHQEGAVDGDAYQAARRRYELEAADILAQLDASPGEEAVPGTAGSTWSDLKSHPTWLLVAIFVGVVIVAIALFLITSAHSLQMAGGTPARATPRVPPQVAAALRETRQHPRSATAFLALGNAYLNAGNANAADQAYRRAMALDPTRPEAPTLYALLLGSRGRYAEALALLRRVELAHPAYSRAWLEDGLLATHVPNGSARAIAAWRRFVALEPHNPLTPGVRQWIAAAQRAARTRKP